METAKKPAGYKILSRNIMKIIAMAAMVVDHTALCFVDSETFLYYIMRSVIGRIAWPVFAMLLAEGLFRTKHSGRHILILLIAAVISEPFYDFMHTGTFIWSGLQNTLWIYLLAAVFVYLLRTETLTIVPKSILCVLWAAVSISGAEFLRLSGGWIGCAGIFTAVLIYMYCRSALWTSAVTGLAWAFENMNPMCLIPVGVTVFYDSEKKCSRSPVFKYACYAFYPFHLLILGLIAILI